jgi:hypothetical protein
MKKQILLLAGAAIILASCGGENKTEDAGQSQAQIDSAVNAQVAEREAEMARKNDSTLKAMEAEKAAAEAAAAEEAAKKGGKKTKTPKASPAPTPAPPPPPPPPPANPKENRFKDQKDQAPADPNAPNKKADRFK